MKLAPGQVAVDGVEPCQRLAGDLVGRFSAQRTARDATAGLAAELRRFWDRLVQTSEDAIRVNLHRNLYGSDKRPYVELYLDRLEAERASAAQSRRESNEAARDDRSHKRAWRWIAGLTLLVAVVIAIINSVR